MKKTNEWTLDQGFTIAEVDKFPDELYSSQLNEHLLGEYPTLPWRDYLTRSDAQKINALKHNLKEKYELRLALLKNNELVGWSYGWQEATDYTNFFMAASMVLPEFRNKGLYTELVKKTLSITSQMGFQSIGSSHIITNNPIIIAKLKLGFQINGLESNVKHGNLVKLTYHHSELRNRVTKFRAGAVGDNETRDLILGKNPTTKNSSL